MEMSEIRWSVVFIVAVVTTIIFKGIQLSFQNKKLKKQIERMRRSDVEFITQNEIQEVLKLLSSKDKSLQQSISEWRIWWREKISAKKSSPEDIINDAKALLGTIAGVVENMQISNDEEVQEAFQIATKVLVDLDIAIQCSSQHYTIADYYTACKTKNRKVFLSWHSWY